MSCCEAPDPRILEKNGRPYCHHCRRYLDHKTPDQDEPPEDPPVLASPAESEVAEASA